jgi:hypothetical protein
VSECTFGASRSGKSVRDNPLIYSEVPMVKFRLLRFASFSMEKKFMELIIDQQIYYEDVLVELRELRDLPQLIRVVASLEFEAPGLSGVWDPSLVDARTRAERAITAVADILAVATCGSRLIESCEPHICVSWDNGVVPDLGTDWEISTGLAKLDPKGNRYIDFTALAGGVTDRISGVALMSLALSNSNGLGKYIALCRLFEDAFAFPAKHLGKKIHQLISTSPIDLRYARREVEEWLSFRDGAAHADLAKAAVHVVESDVLKFIPRMQQAAFDVLLNKETWHNKSSNRRNLCYPSFAFVNDKPFELVCTVGRPIDHTQHMVDPFCEWPISTYRFIPAENAKFPKISKEFPMKTVVLPA